MATLYDLLSDGELSTMADRAWREAVRSYSEARGASRAARPMLLLAASAAELYWEELRDELTAREEDLRDDTRSADVYEVQPEVFDLPDGGKTTIEPVLRKAPKESPWVTAARHKTLPSKTAVPTAAEKAAQR